MGVRVEAPVSKPPTLNGICLGCGSPNGLWQPQHETMYCPVCAAKNDEWDAAKMHLGSLLGPVITAWYRHWRARGAEADVLLEMNESGDLLTEAVAALKGYESKFEAAPHLHVLSKAA